MELKDFRKVLISPKLENVSKKEILSLYQIYGYKLCGFVKMNNELYHMKTNKLALMLNELIGEIISEYFDLQTKKSIIVMDENNLDDKTMFCSLLAKSFMEHGLSYCNMDAFTKIKHLDKNKLANLNRLQSFYNVDEEWGVRTNREDLNTLKSELKKMIIRDFLTKQRDRGFQNFMFGYKDNHIKLMPLYDYEYSFNDYIYPNFFEIDLNNRSIRRTLKNDIEFQELLYKLMDFSFNYVLEKLEEEHGLLLSDKEIQKYNGVIESQQRLVRENKMLR